MNQPVTRTHREILKQIAHLKEESPNVADSITIVAASKSQPPEHIIEAIGVGITHFGENRVQEAMDKWPQIREIYPHIILQFIGHLQSNKVKDAVSLFDEIASVDRISLAQALKEEMERQHKALPCLIQVNTGEEPQKSGVLPKDADTFIRECIEKLHLPVVGLMCVPPAEDYPAPHFALLADIAKRHGLKRLSMGMSSDYVTAIRMGATEIRLGTVLFGERSA